MSRRRFRKGDKVITDFTVKPKQYASKLGTVSVTLTREGEVGVIFGNSHSTVWFLPTELHLQQGTQPSQRPTALANRQGVPEYPATETTPTRKGSSNK